MRRAPLLLLVPALLAASAAAQDRPPPIYSSEIPEGWPGCVYVVEQLPELIGGLASIRPVYPESESGSVEGRVLVQFVVGADGAVSDITVTRSLAPAFDAAAVEAVRHARFRPGMQRGHPVPVRFSLPVTFRLE